VSYSRNGRPQQRHSRQERRYAHEQQFTCVHCHLYVSCDPLVAGVQNRNHCPYCLWSRHLDWREAGDRMSNCRAPMEPVGLTTKWSRNKYAAERDGELMIIHRCTGCDRLVINRVAADDGAEDLLALFERSLALGPGFKAELELLGVAPLAAGDGDLVSRRLFGGAAGLVARRARRAS
jgi:hypothetical protein